MSKSYARSLFRKIVLPIVASAETDILQEYSPVVELGCCLAQEGELVLVGVVVVPLHQSLSQATPQARQVRNLLQALEAAPCAWQATSVNIRDQVCVSHHPWQDLLQIINTVGADLLLLSLPTSFEALGIQLDRHLAYSPCDVAAFRAPLQRPADAHFCPQEILVPLRGGPHAELALKLAISLALRPVGAPRDRDAPPRPCRLTTLHVAAHPKPQDLPAVIPPRPFGEREAGYRGLERVLENLPDVRKLEVVTDDPAEAILEAAQQADLIVMGTTARALDQAVSIGAVAERVLQQSAAGVILVKSRRPLPPDMTSELSGSTAISVLVDKWFAENTYSADEFADLEYLLQLKREQGLSVALALPALNEEETIGGVIRTLKSALLEQCPLLDELVLVDSNSTDRTRQIAEELGVPVYIHQQVLPRLGSRHGKGEALWKSLYLTRSDIVLWIDTDIVNIHPRFVYGLLGPLLKRPDIQFVKGFYRRPLRVGDKIQAGGGGRVTELTARPLINLFYPELSGIIQPLAGEYGGRRALLERLPFFSGYGVEIGLLIDVFEHCGLNAIAQVDLQERIHRNQPLEALSKMSFAIIQAITRKLERRFGRSILEEVNKTMKLIRYDAGRLFLEVEEIAEQERPPMISVPEYRQLWQGQRRQEVG